MPIDNSRPTTGFQDTHCGRCQEATPITLMSWFNTQTLCLACQKDEAQHPDFNFARSVERQHTLAGNYNFPGIGWPGKHKRVDPPARKDTP